MGWHDSEAYAELIDVFNFLGYVAKLSPHKSNKLPTDGAVQDFLCPNIAGEPIYLILDKTNSRKQRFLELFVNRGWQPKLRKMSPHGPRSGPSAQVDSLDNPISTIWEIRDPDNLSEWGMIDNSLEAELLGEVGSGGNERIYVWSGYLASYPEGYSNMILMEWFDDYSDSEKKDDIAGEIYYGEKAYRRLKEIRSRFYEELPFYPSINRRKIP
jgi:hypothetical protein